MVKAIIWDMDGVIMDTEFHHSASEIATFKHFGAELTEEINQNFKGTRVSEHLKHLKDYLKVEASIEEITNKLNEFIVETFSTKADIFGSAKEVLTELKKSYKQGLATSTERRFVNIVIKRFGLEEIFDAITCGDEIDKGKPDPEIFLKTAEKLDVVPGEVAVIEDSLNGFKAAKGAGMLLIAHKAHHNQDLDFSLADFVVEDLREIPEILEKINTES